MEEIDTQWERYIPLSRVRNVGEVSGWNHGHGHRGGQHSLMILTGESKRAELQKESTRNSQTSEKKDVKRELGDLVSAKKK